MLKDIRQAIRLLAKNPGFTAIAALSLAIGIGANSAVFSFADALLLRPLPVDDPNGVVTVSTDTPDNSFGPVSFPDYRDFRDKSQTFASLAAFDFYTFGFAASAAVQPQMRMGFVVSDNFFQVLRIQPALGRAFLPDEAKVPGRDAIAVLSYDLWANQFGRDHSVIGRNIRLNGIDFTVIGVAPQSFTGMDPFIRPALYVPLSMSQRLAAAPKNPLDDRSAASLQLRGRLKPGVSRQQAQAELIAIAKNLEKAYPDTNRNHNVAVRTELQARMQQDPYDSALAIMLMALVALVLLIACANVANLLLSRSRARSREIAIRLAIGVGRARLVRQLLTESMILALFGGTLGLGLAYLGIRFLKGIPIPTDLPVVIGVQLDQRVLLASVLAAVVSALIFGIAPALQAVKTDLIAGLRSAGLSSSARRRTLGRNALVIGQVAFSMVLLVAAGMIFDGFRKALVLNPGFRTDHLMLMEFDTRFVRYSDDQSRVFYRNVVDRASTLSGVRSVALGAEVPMSPNQSNQTVMPEGYQFPKGQESATVLGSIVDQHYFDTMKMPIIRGRAFTAADRADSRPVAIVNEAFAKKYWPNQDAVGKRLRLKDKNGPLAEVVGLTKTSRYIFISEPPFPFVYLPYAQNFSSHMSVFVETASDPAEIAAPLRAVARSLDANMPVYNARTMSNLYQQRTVGILLMILQLVSTLGLLGLALALIGLYGLIAYSVSRRTQEIGIRMALGAHRSDVLRMILGQGFVLSMIGVAIGLAASIGVRRFLAIGLIGIGSTNPAVLLIVPLALILVAMAACYLPARRASQVDPIRALRWE
jgi:macrolide transport system ATP-binding/permease protein